MGKRFRSLYSRMPASRRTWVAVAASVALVLFLTQIAWGTTVIGSIGSNTIEIDSPVDGSGNAVAPGADLYPGSTTCTSGSFPTSGTLDWVADCLTNTDPSGAGTGTLSGGVATGLEAGVTSASPVCNGTTVTTNCAKGHWNGVRIVDGVGGNDQDIFLTGGKENCPFDGDCSSNSKGWNVGPGTVGSSKYDASQMYLANNQTTLYFGMERIGNNGTTAFDFEFNKLSPNVAPINCPVTTPQTPCYVPNRSDGDVLLTFEMSGSGSSGSAVAHYFTFTCSPACPHGSYTEQALPNGVVTSINDSTSTLGEPWGHVDGRGNWNLGSLDRFTFAEAAVPLTALGINGPQCGGSRFVEIRTRSSATDTSDLKDTTPIFNYSFGSPSAAESLSTACADPTVNNGNPTFTFNGAGSKNSAGGITGLTYHWDIKVSPYNVNLSSQTTGVTLTKTTTGDANNPAVWTTGDTSASTATVLADLVSAGVQTASVSVRNTITEGVGCSDSTAFQSVNLFLALGISASLTPSCTNSFTFSATATGGNAPYSFSWVFQIADASVTTGTTPGWRTVTPTVTYDQSDHHSGTATVSEQGTYRALATVTDTADTATVGSKPQCTAHVTTSTIQVRNALTAGASKTGTTLTNSNPSNWSADLTGSATAGTLAGDSIAYQWQMLVGSTWTNITGATSSTFSYSSFQTDATPTTLASPFTIGTDSYNGKVWSVQIRVHITRTTNSGNTVCQADSSSVTVKKVIGVDP